MARKTGPTLVQVGKNGITDNTIEEILKNVKKNKELRVKFLRNFLTNSDRHEAVEVIRVKLTEKLDKKAKFDSKLVGNILLIKRNFN